MPGKEFSKKVDTPKKERQWSAVYEGMKKAGKSSSSAIKGANAAVKKSK